MQEFESDYLQFIGGLTLLFSYLILISLASTALYTGQFAGAPLLITGLFFVFIAFYVPSLILLGDLFGEIWEQSKKDEISRGYLLILTIVVGIVYAILVRLNPV